MTWQWPWWEAGDVWCLPPVWNLRAVIWFHFTIFSLVLLPGPVTLSVLSCFFSACWSILLKSFKKILIYVSLRDRLFCMAPVQQLREVSWSMVSAACCHMALVFPIMHLYNIFLIVLSHLVLINRQNGPRYQRVLALCAFFFFLTGAIQKRLILRNFFVFDVCVCFVICKFVSGLIL